MTTTLHAYIDGRVLKLFRPMQSKAGNIYWSTPKGRYGVKVDGSVTPNGYDTEFRVGTDLDNSVRIPLLQEPDTGTAARGEVEVEIAGRPMLASAYFNPLPDGTATIKVSCRNKPAKPAAKTAAEVLG